MSLSTHNSSISFERVTVLGGLGFMGSHICRELARRGYVVRVFDRPGASRVRVADFENRLEIVSGDFTRADDVLGAIADADLIINLVHTTVPGSSMTDPEFDVTSNVVATVAWLRQLDKTKVRKVIYVSSGGTVYGVPKKLPISEEHPTNPICSYGITKLAIEKYIAMYATAFQIDYQLLRPSNAYGPGAQLHFGQGVIGVLADRALRHEALEVWGSGNEQRDYLFIDDLVRAVMLMITYRGSENVFNVSSGRGHSVNDIVSLLRKQIGDFPSVAYLEARGFDVPVNVLDSTRLQHETGWRPEVDLETGIGRTIEWLKKRSDET